MIHGITALNTRRGASADRLLPTLFRFSFAAVLAGYFWASALTKVGDGLFGVFSPSLGAYAQIFPRAMEAVGYDVSRLGLLHWAVVVSGTLAEFILPFLIIVGLATRAAALGMIGFIVVQSLTDIIGHHADPTTIGSWFDRIPDSTILDQRLLWTMLLATLIVKGAGPLSLDALFRRRLGTGRA